MNTGNCKFLIVTAALTVALAGCSSAEKNVTPPPAPAPVAAPAPPPPPPPMVKVPAPSYVVEDVNFEFDKSNLKPMATGTLDEVVSGLRAQPGVPYEVAGYTDSIGSETYNQGLSERRAESVRAYLIDHGVDAGQLSVRGYGEASPVASNSSKDGRAKNRRVEIRAAK